MPDTPAEPIVRCSTSWMRLRSALGGGEERFFAGAHWASLAELADWPDIMAPRSFAELLPRILAGDYTAEPIDTDA